MNKNEINISGINKEYNKIFEDKYESDYFTERIYKLKNNNNAYNKNSLFTSFQKFNKINILKKNKKSIRAQSQRNISDKRIQINLKNYGLSNLNSSEKLNSNQSNAEMFISPNGKFLPEINEIKSKENKTFSLANNSLKDNCNSSTISLVSKTSKIIKYPLKKINLNKNYQNGSVSERTNNTSNFTFHNNYNLYYLRKYVQDKNNNKSNLNKSSYNALNNINNKNVKYEVPQESKNIVLNSLAVKTLSSKFPLNKTTNNNIIKVCDLKTKELLERKKFINTFIKEEEKKRKQIEIANFFDSIPNLIIKKNIEQNKNIFFEKLVHKYLNFLNIKIENKNDKLNSLFNMPIIKYVFLQNILNSLTHKIDLKDTSFDKYNEIILNNFNIEEFN